ncbi:MAG TPA: hypothetical protein VK484_08035 [Ferruginibacter sp.]|nr:hypothetical protein [Ferruginibacter sp.]
MKKLLMLVCLVAFLHSCKKNDPATDEAYGVVRDFTGWLDGCKMMIVLNNGDKLEIRSFPAGVTLIDGKKVAIKYTVTTGNVSICMAGDIVDITSLRYL